MEAWMFHLGGMLFDRLTFLEVTLHLQARLGSIVIARYEPTSHPQSLVLQPSGHILFDHIVIGLLILMRDHLTPKVSQVGDAVGMFNYRSYNVPE
jgi:hypothetical protein